MRRLWLVGVVVLMLALVFGLASTASADPGGPQFCQETHNFWGLFSNQGQCVSFYQTWVNGYQGNREAVEFCKYLEDAYGDYHRFPLGECVSFFARYF